MNSGVQLEDVTAERRALLIAATQLQPIPTQASGQAIQHSICCGKGHLLA